MKKGIWKDRAAKNDFMYTECSECEFTVEAYRAVKIGRASANYVGVEWNYCPKCGAKMDVENADKTTE